MQPLHGARTYGFVRVSPITLAACATSTGARNRDADRTRRSARTDKKTVSASPGMGSVSSQRVDNLDGDYGIFPKAFAGPPISIGHHDEPADPACAL